MRATMLLGVLGLLVSGCGGPGAAPPAGRSDAAAGPGEPGGGAGGGTGGSAGSVSRADGSGGQGSPAVDAAMDLGVVDVAPIGDGGAPGPAAIAWERPIDGRPTFAGPTVMGSVTVNRAMRAGRVEPGFLGLSFEKSHLTDAFFAPGNAPLVALFRLLGPCVLRIGANDVDRTTWDPAAQPVAAGTFGHTVGTAAVDALAAFLRATGWRVIYGVNLKTGTPANSAAEAKYVAGKLGASLYGFELGNEINLGGVAYPDRKVQWESFFAAVHAAVPDAPLVGPATNPGGLGGFLVPFVKDEAPKLRLVSHHYYRGSGSSAGSTMDKLLSADPGLVRTLQAVAAATRDGRVPDGFRLAETASFSSHGAAGVSDAFGAALWALDFFFDNAGNGSSGINFHGGSQGEDGNRPFYYAPIGEAKSAVTDARPVYYGMLAMAVAGQGDVLATTAAAGTLNFSAHALAAANDALMLVLVNKDATTGIEATVDVGAPATEAAAIYLQAATLGATSGVTLAGAGVSAGGAWVPARPFRIAPADRKLLVPLPAASAAIVRVR
jgi:hypothetical protein